MVNTIDARNSRLTMHQFARLVFGCHLQDVLHKPFACYCCLFLNATDQFLQLQTINKKRRSHWAFLTDKIHFHYHIIAQVHIFNTNFQILVMAVQVKQNGFLVPKYNCRSDGMRYNKIQELSKSNQQHHGGSIHG